MNKLKIKYPMTALFFLALITQVIITYFSGIPRPRSYDEFHFLFAADTFARGLLTNPAHPLWFFFDKGVMINTPTFMIKYQPGPGFFLALGQVLFGEPFYGVIFSICLFAGSFYWLLRSIIPQHIAFPCALFIVAYFATNYWGRSYWGGALEASGACLVLGSYLYSRNAQKLSKSLQLGLGCALLFFTRPFEGGVFFIAVLLCCILDIYKRNISLNNSSRFLIISMTAAILILSFQGLYNYKITGSVKTMPYVLYMRQSATAPVFWLQKQLTPEIKPHTRFGKDFNCTWRDLSGYKKIAALSPGRKLLVFASRTFNTLFLLPFFPFVLLAAMPWSGLDSLSRRLWFTILIGSSASALVVWQFTHYLAAIIAAMLTLVAYTISRTEAEIGAPHKTKIFFSGALLLLCGIYLLAGLQNMNKVLDKEMTTFSKQRYETARHLNSLPTNNLVFVRYADDYRFFEQWVYNTGNIDAQKTVFAYDFGRRENQKLIDYYRSLGQHRTIWLLDVDHGAKLAAY